MAEDALRRKVEKATGELPDTVWRFLEKEGYLHVEGEEDLDVIVSGARNALLLATPVRPKRARMRRGLKAPSLEHHPRLLDIEELRRDVLTEHFAKEAARHPEVRRFRREVLAGGTLTQEEAHRWLESEAVCTFSLPAFRDAGIDPLHHESSLVSHKVESGVYHAEIRVEGRRALWKYDEPIDALQSSPSFGDGRQDTWIKTDKEKIRVDYRVGSVFAALISAAWRTVLPGYPHGADMKVWFFLTDYFPPVLAAEGSWMYSERATHRLASINLELAPWVSVDTVSGAFRKMQSELLKRHNRPISRRRLTLFRFVTAKTNEDGEVPTWRSLLPIWNSNFPEWPYKDVRNLSRDYWATARQLLKPEYVWANSEEDA